MQPLRPEWTAESDHVPVGRSLAPVASRAVERVMGRPPAYYQRKGRIFWAAWRRSILWSFTAILALVVGFTSAGLPFRAAATHVTESLVLAAGLRVGSIVIEGDDGIPDADVIDALSPFKNVPLPFFDVAEAREKLMAIPRVRSATVMKLYPNTLHLKIEEREPFALWQRAGKMAVIDRDGRIVRSAPDGSQTALPLFVGEGANVSAHTFQQALNDTPSVKARVKAAVRVADRRWTLKLDNGVDVRLPETGAAEALATLAKMMRQPRFFDQPIASIDLRLADRVTLTLTEEGAVARRTLLERQEQDAGERHT